MLQSSRSEIRQRLIESTIHVVARDGIEKATTKAISNEAGINEVYIYRLFDDKLHLFESVYDMLDDEMIGSLTKYLSVVYMNELSVNERTWLLFERFWNFLLSNVEKCSYFIKYYYSDFYDTYPVARREKKYEYLLEKFSVFLCDSTYAKRLLDHAFDVMFSTVIKVIRRELPNDDKTARELYDFLVGSLSKHFLSFDEDDIESVEKNKEITQNDPIPEKM